MVYQNEPESNLRGSKNRKRSAVRLARLHRRIRCIRQDFLHKPTTHLAKTKRVVVVEDLSVNGMLKNPKLARHIADMGWGEFRRMLEYKCVWYGSRLIKVNRYFPSSKTCSYCGEVLESLPLSVREWTCPGCGTHHDRDVNAAKNLLISGLATLNDPTGSSPGSHACGHRRLQAIRPVPVGEAGSSQGWDICPGAAERWSTTRIAEAVGVSDASVRRDLSPSTFVEPEATNATVIGLDGKRYPAKKKPAVFALV